MRNPYAITQKQDGWWLVLDEPCMTHTIGKAAQLKHVAVLHALECFKEQIQDAINELQINSEYADELIDARLVDVIAPNCARLSKGDGVRS